MSPAKRYFIIGARLVFGALFVYSGLHKIGQPYQFAAAIQAYQLMPEFLVGLSAVLIPWLETVSAAALLTGYKPRSALLILLLLVATFSGIIGLTMIRGLDIDCGCGLLADRRVGWLVLAEDTALLLALAWLYYALWPASETAPKS